MLKPKSKVSLLVFCCSLAICGMLIPARLTYTTTDSVRYRLFLYSKNPHRVSKGDYVMLHIMAPHYSSNPVRVIKKITCDQGEYLNVVDREYFCGGGQLSREYLGRAKEYSLKGEKLNNFVFSGIIPEGYAFISSDHRDSYDSRYFGLIPKSSIEAVAYPIF